MKHSEAMKIRRSRRAFVSKELDKVAVEILNEKIKEYNAEGNLRFCLKVNSPNAFSSMKSSYGFFTGVKNYIVLASKKKEHAYESIGYWGEKIMLDAITLGIDSCWVGGTFDKEKIDIHEDEILYGVIVIGYTKEKYSLKEKVIANVVRRKTKAPEEMCKDYINSPTWFQEGMKSLVIAPSAKNMQAVFIEMIDGSVIATIDGDGPHHLVDLGIGMYHFEIGSGGGNWELKNGGKFKRNITLDEICN